MRPIDYFDRGHDLDPSRLAIVDGELRFTFAETKALTQRIARAMYAGGYARQSGVALYSPNSAWALIALLALWRAEAKWVPVNTRNAMDANVAYLNYVRCEWLFYHSSLTPDVEALRAQVPSLRHFVCLDQANGNDPSLDDFMAPFDAADFDDRHADPFGNLDDIVGIFPTGGTTGPSKGVNVTNLGWGTMIETASDAFRDRTDDPVVLVTAPITHAAGPVSLATYVFGSTQIIMPGFDADDVVRNIAKYRVSHIYLPPTAMYGVLNSPELGKHDLSSMRILHLAGSPAAPEKIREAVERIGPCISQSYGQVESPMITCWMSPEEIAASAAGDHPERLASCGRPTRSVKVGIMDDEGNLLPPGEAGEIVVRGPLVSQGYFEMPEATAEVRTFGWHHTGDIARRDEHGYVYIVDRKKDMVVTGGFNVYSAEVEGAIMELEAVAECAVIGIPHDHWGEQVHAVVVTRGAIDEAAIIAHTKARLGGVKAPKTVSFVAAIARTPAGKMDKKALRIPYWGEQARMVH